MAQEYSYSHYDSKEGLAGSTVYCMTQDKEGFLWFGTETGLSRYDGTHFKNFTREDGLPDNEIIQLFADSKGRVWLSPFRKTICYYYKGVIHNSDNDSLLKKLNIKENVLRFAEDAGGNILLQEFTRLHIIHANGEITTILTNGNKPLGYITLINGRAAGGFWVLLNDKIYILENGRFLLWKTIEYRIKHFNYAAMNGEMLIWRNNPKEVTAISMRGKRNIHYPFYNNKGHLNTVALDDHFIATCSYDGAFVYSVDHPDSIQNYLPGISVSNMFKDSEGNWWFCTLGKGVYRLNSAVVLNLRFADKNQQDLQILAFERYKDWILATTKEGGINKMSIYTGKPEGHILFPAATPNPIYALSTAKDKRIITGTMHFLAKLSPDLSRYSSRPIPLTVKAMCSRRDDILVATDKNVVAIDQESLNITDTLWHERATCLFSNNDTIYIGTLNGMYMITPGEKLLHPGENIRALQSRIAAICEDQNHIIWAATSGEGLIAWRNGKLIKQITRHDGLTSNICRTLFLANGKLWVGTDKGVNKVNVMLPGFPIEKYTTSDGLSSNIINAIYVHEKKVFVGTTEGVAFFDEEKMTSQSRCDLRFIDVTIGGEIFHPSDAPVTIPHEKNSIRFNYVGISYKSGGDIRYRYRLLGLDSTWKETRETFLSYPTLPSGDYLLQLQAVNKFDVHSRILAAAFTIEKLLYEKTWFRLLIALLFLTATGLLVWLIGRRIRKREQEKTRFVKRIGELEQLSRKAQMNPHFVFNSLNSIQQYVMDADVAGANKFISGFSRLIRQTLDFSSKPEISLEEELDYLTNYLELEKTRLENAFSYSVSIEDGVHPADYYIPPMILQPFVENSVRHGLRFRKDKAGIVTITVRLENKNLVCILEDNGVGRKAAMAYKSITPINYQSKGLSLTADRITMFNKEHEHKIYMQIDDLEDNFHNALGTRVTISFPVF